MRHRVAGRGLGRTSSHRKALIRNQVTELLRHERIVTTEAKAKTIRPAAEKVITLGKRGTLHARRQAGAILTDRGVLKLLFDDIAPRFQTRPGGYTRIVKLGPRQGDGAHMALIELVEGPVTSATDAAPTSEETALDTEAAEQDDTAAVSDEDDDADETAADADDQPAASVDEAAADDDADETPAEEAEAEEAPTEDDVEDGEAEEEESEASDSKSDEETEPEEEEA